MSLCGFTSGRRGGCVYLGWMVQHGYQEQFEWTLWGSDRCYALEHVVLAVNPAGQVTE